MRERQPSILKKAVPELTKDSKPTSHNLKMITVKSHKRKGRIVRTHSRKRSVTNSVARAKLARGVKSLGSAVGANAKHKKSFALRQVLADQPKGDFSKSHAWQGNYKKKKTK